MQNLDDSAKKYNSTAEDLKLIPHTARNANGKNLAIDIDIRLHSCIFAFRGRLP